MGGFPLLSWLARCLPFVIMVSKVMGEGELEDRAKVIFAELEKKKERKKRNLSP